MITEKQVREAFCEGPHRLGREVEDNVVAKLRLHGLIVGCANCAPIPEPDKPLLKDRLDIGYGVGAPCNESVIRDHQAALDEFAREVRDVELILSGCAGPPGATTMRACAGRLCAANAKARKAGLTRVGA